jgi:hypothetical protein
MTLGLSQSMICSTGNGCLTMIGWIDNILIDDETERERNEASLREDRSKKPKARIIA